MSDSAKVKNLWGDLPLKENISTPYIILKEQASILTEATDGLLIGEAVKGESIFDNIYSHLRIKVPSLNNYTINIVSTSYPATMYPLEIINLVANNSKSEECKDENDFKEKLAKILSSTEVKRIVAGLLTEVRSDTEN